SGGLAVKVPPSPHTAPRAPVMAAHCSLRFDSENMFMSMPEPSQDFVPANQSYPVPSLGDEDFNIPPITPPTLPEHMLPHLAEPESGVYHPLCPPPGSQSGLHPFHLQGMDLPGITVPSMLSQDGSLLTNSLSVMQQMVNSDSRYSHLPMEALRPRGQSGMVPQGQHATINPSQVNSQLGLGGTHGSPSPPESKSATPSPSSSVHEDDGEDSLKVRRFARGSVYLSVQITIVKKTHFPLLQMNGSEKRPASDMAKKPKTPKKKKKKDPNEPQKPVSAYALFFRDTQAAIKGQNPNATFGEVSKIVASMWDGLGEEQKQV
uniref:HMG box domain-containing protein n=1 Tax=Denticeps clupeoides TaxID=299321 RepID=A0AAY4B1N7_9TELE